MVFKTIADATSALTKLAVSPDRRNEPAPIPESEEVRLRSLEAICALDRALDFQPLTAKLTRIFETRIAVLSFIARDAQRFVAQTGLPSPLAEAGETPRDSSICAHIVAADELVVIEDLARDRRFSNNPVIKGNKFRFYAGAPVHSPDGQAIGALCVMDTTPREFSASERRLLSEYAKDITNEIANRAES